MSGQLLKKIREGKGMTINEVASEIISPAQLRKIETNGHQTSFENQMNLLNRLNVSIEEFIYLAKDSHSNFHLHLKNDIREAIRLKDVKKINALLSQLEINKEESCQSNYFLHSKCLLKAELTMIKTGNNVEKARKELTAISDYLGKVDQWYLYELRLLNNSLIYYDFETAVSLGEKALQNIQKHYEHFKNSEISRALLNNLATLSLKEEQYMKAYHYSSASIGLPNSTRFLYENTLSRITNQVACYKLQNSQYDPVILRDAIRFFNSFNMAHLSENIQSFLNEHGVILD